MKRVCLSLAAALALALAGCAGPAESGAATPAPPTEAPASTAAPAPTEAPAPTAAPVPAGIGIAYDDGSLPEGGYDEYADAPTGYEVRLVLTADAPVADFCFLALALAGSDDAGGMTFTAEPLYTADTLAPGRPLVVSMTFAGIVPDRGISYTDTDGSTKYFSIEMSGEDGSPLLVPFAPAAA